MFHGSVEQQCQRHGRSSQSRRVHSLMYRPCKSTCLCFVFLSIVAPTQVRSSTSIALFTGYGVRCATRQSFDLACLVEIRAGITVYTTEMFHPVKPSARSQVVVGDVGTSMKTQSFGLRASARLAPEASRTRRMFLVFEIDSRPFPIGTLCSLCELRPSREFEGPILTCVACLLDFRLSCNQHVETVLDSRCAAEAGLHRICQADADAAILHARLGIILLRLQIHLFLSVIKDQLGQVGANCNRVTVRNHAVSPRTESAKLRKAHLINIVFFFVITKTNE